uniref:Uncharacterized protein n=1 Tax=Opuntia streptacantha TaxID=393608 RepID=A0A7C9AP28_OPUST
MADTIDGDPWMHIRCDCGEAVDIVPAIGDRFRRYTVCHQRKCGHFMWMDQPLSRAEKVTVKKLEAENRRLRSSLLSISATMRKVTNNHGDRQECITCRLDAEACKFMLFIIIVAVYNVTMSTFTSY